MDSLTQAALGAAIGKSFFRKGNNGTIAGAIVGSLPDLDVALYLFYDPYEMLSIHRGLSHSLFFCIIASVLISIWIKKTKWFKTHSYATIISFTGLVYFTHILLDTFTTYGTQLWLPFSNERVGFDNINVVDPIYTLPLLLGLILSSFYPKKKGISFNNYGLILSSIYLVFTLFHKQKVEVTISEKLEAENIAYSKLLTVPVGIANLNWSAVAKGRDSLYMLKYSAFNGCENTSHSFAINEKYLEEVNPEVVEKMKWFAKDFYTVEKNGEDIKFYNLQIDMRGIVEKNGKKAPTKGFFLLSTNNEATTISSGSE